MPPSQRWPAASHTGRSPLGNVFNGRLNMGLIKEFKEFAVKGNVIDMAVGIIIGAAFTSIVNSLVNDVIMPPIGLALGGIDFSGFSVQLKEATTDAATGKVTPAVMLNYGRFINATISFLIVAWVVFIMVKLVNMAKKKEAAAPAPPSKSEELLTEIRDLLKRRAV
jgi:large conductance mechanosensitive channel